MSESETTIQPETVVAEGQVIADFQERLDEVLKSPDLLMNRDAADIVSPSAGKTIRYHGNPDL